MSIKNKMTKVLSVALACAMSVTVFTACDTKKDKKKDNESLSVKEMILEYFDLASNTNTLSGVFSGDANTASKMNAEIEFGSGVTDALGTEVKPLAITSETKLKGDKAGTDIAFSYDNKNLVSVNGVYDNKEKAGYIKVPELSDAYVSVTEEYLKSLSNELIDGYTGSSTELNNLLSSGGSVSSMSGKLSDLKMEEWGDILNDYIKVFVDALPEASKEEDYKGDISGVEYDYKLKTYTLTVDDGKKMIEDIFAKLKTDEKVKEIAVSLLGSSLELTSENYSSKLDTAKKELLDSLADETSSEEISLIFDGKDIVGIKDEATFMVIDQKDAYVASIESETVKYTFKATKDDEKLDFDMTMDIIAKEEGDKDLTISLDADDFEIVDKDNKLTSGDVDATIKVGDNTVKLEASDKANADDKKVSSTCKLTVDDVEYLTMNTTNEITNASDITVPSGTIYTLDKIEEYQKSMKTEEFLTNVQTVLGNDLISAFSKISESIGNSDEDTDLSDDIEVSDEEDAIDLEKYYNDDGSFNYDKLKKDLGEEEYEAFMSQIDLDDFEVDANDIEL